MPAIFSDPETELDPFAAPSAPATPTPPDQARPARTLRIPHWRKGPQPDLTEDAIDEDPEDEELDDEGEYEDDSDDEPAEPRRRWNPRGSGAHTRPRYREPRPVPRQTPVEWWRRQPARNRWAAYNGTALACGFALHLPQLATAQTAYLVDTYHSWTDVHVYTWYLVTALIWACDHTTRRWHWALALPCRIPLISIVVGVLLYGSSDLPA